MEEEDHSGTIKIEKAREGWCLLVYECGSGYPLIFHIPVLVSELVFDDSIKILGYNSSHVIFPQ